MDTKLQRPAALARRAPRASRLAISVALAVVAPLAHAQGTQQTVRGPTATYWLSADTTSGIGAMGAGGIGSMLGMLAGRAPSAVRTLDLRLASSLAPSAPPEASHLIPPGMAMGPSLPLVSPEPSRPAPPEPAERSVPQGMEQPKGRMLIFWGCGERVGTDQPIVIDFSKIGPGQPPLPNLVSRTVRVPRGPAFGASRSYGAWPNERDRQPVPAQASLRGEHEVRGNYSPPIRFSVEQHDFMPAVELSSSGAPSGARRTTWRPVGGATGYFMSAVGANAAQDGSGADVVMWTSSAVQEMGGMLADYLPPGEVARLIRERVVMPPDRTECLVPAEVMKAIPMAMLNFVAYGDELNVSHPPRPADPKVPWDIQYAVKLRLKSTTMMPLADGVSGMMGAGGAARQEGTPAASGGDGPAASAPADSGGTSQPPGTPVEAVEQGVREGVRVLRGLFGR
jgi:hypothetical protein